jgi:hypothetical protein
MNTTRADDMADKLLGDQLEATAWTCSIVYVMFAFGGESPVSSNECEMMLVTLYMM